MIVERFAPSPTGLLHLGHGFSALTAFRAAQAAGGRFLLRIEDIDHPRCRPEFESAIYQDLIWLGIDWENPVMHQSQRLAHYGAAVDRLIEMGICYPCACTRKDIANALSAPQEGSACQIGPDGPIYPGTCKSRPIGERGATDAIRLNMGAAIRALGGENRVNGLSYLEIGDGTARTIPLSANDLLTSLGDIVLARKDIATSYNIAVVLDDAAQGVTHVTRGQDMAPTTPIHRLLQALLGLPTPIYRHHRLIRDASGKRLAKRHDAMALRAYRTKGLSASEVIEMF